MNALVLEVYLIVLVTVAIGLLRRAANVSQVEGVLGKVISGLLVLKQYSLRIVWGIELEPELFQDRHHWNWVYHCRAHP